MSLELELRPVSLCLRKNFEARKPRLSDSDRSFIIICAEAMKYNKENDDAALNDSRGEERPPREL